MDRNVKNTKKIPEYATCWLKSWYKTYLVIENNYFSRRLCLRNRRYDHVLVVFTCRAAFRFLYIDYSWNIGIVYVVFVPNKQKLGTRTYVYQVLFFTYQVFVYTPGTYNSVYVRFVLDIWANIRKYTKIRKNKRIWYLVTYRTSTTEDTCYVYWCTTHREAETKEK